MKNRAAGVIPTARWVESQQPAPYLTRDIFTVSAMPPTLTRAM